MTTVGVVVVTFESERFLARCLGDLRAGDRAPDRVVVVDNGSIDTGYLDAAADGWDAVTVHRAGRNLGFCAGNNLGIDRLGDVDLVLLCNPDAFVTPGFLAGAVAAMEADPRIGALQPKLTGTDPDTFAPTGLLDCTGIFQTALGRVFDRGQGEPDDGRHDHGLEDVPAVCAAAMLCRRGALDAVAEHGQVLDETFFMFKEDVDLSYRLHRAGWRVVYDPSLEVRHCRGNTQVVRRTIPGWVRRRSLANEWRLWRKRVVPRRLQVPMFFYLCAKSVLVALGR